MSLPKFVSSIFGGGGGSAPPPAPVPPAVATPAAPPPLAPPPTAPPPPTQFAAGTAPGQKAATTGATFLSAGATLGQGPVTAQKGQKSLLG